MVPLLPKLRGHFAEFLNHDSPVRFSILYLTTSVGLGYGRLKPRVEAFLDSTGSPNFNHNSLTIKPHPSRPPDLPRRQATLLDAPSHKTRAGYLSASLLLTR